MKGIFSMGYKVLSLLMALVRLLGILLHILGGLQLALLLYVLRGKQWYLSPTGKKIKQTWMKLACMLLNIDISRYGRPGTSATLVVANHISWVDIMVLGAISPCTFVAKSNVLQWPIIGKLASISGTIFVERENRRNAIATLDRINYCLENECSVVIFPEGTTTTGIELGNFFPLFFESAIRAQKPMQSTALYYPDNMMNGSHVPFIGEQSFAPHLLRFLVSGYTPTEVFFCGPVQYRGDVTRKELMNLAYNQIEQVLRYRDECEMAEGVVLVDKLDSEVYSI